MCGAGPQTRPATGCDTASRSFVGPDFGRWLASITTGLDQSLRNHSLARNESEARSIFFHTCGINFYSLSIDAAHYGMDRNPCYFTVLDGVFMEVHREIGSLACGKR